MKKSNLRDFLFIALVFVALICLSIAIIGGLIYVMSICFGFEFSWKLAIGIWCVIVLLKSIFGKDKNAD